MSESAVSMRSPAVPLQPLRDIFEKQKANQSRVRQCSASERVEKLRHLKKAIAAHREELVEAMQAEFRKPRMEVELSEIQLVFTELEHAMRNLSHWMKRKPVSTPLHLLGTRSEIRQEPKGVVLILAAWNYPFALLFAPLIAAVSAGNCVMMRGSERVPNTCEVAGRIVAESFASDEVSLVQGDVSVAKALLDLPFDHIF